MTKTFYSLLLICLLTCFSNTLISQSNATISSIKQNGKQYEITITSNKTFYVGGNTHVLHIGKKDFSLNKQINENGHGTIIFYVTEDEFNSLADGETIWMSYGNKIKQSITENIDPNTFFNKDTKNDWLLGKLNKSQLQK